MYERYCLWCHSELKPYWSTRLYCSKKCGNLYRGGVVTNRPLKICPVCKQEFKPYHNDTVYCSTKCRLERYITKKGLNNTIIEWNTLREFIIERDNFTCSKCGYFSMSNGLNVHHVKPLSEGGTNSINNLITLCSKCHSTAHGIPSEITQIELKPIIHP